MNHDTQPVPLLVTLDELVQASPWDKAWVLALLDESVIEPVDALNSPSLPTDEPTAPMYFDSIQLSVVRTASRLRRDFDASPQAIGLILSLLDELRPLRQLHRQLLLERQINDI